MNPAVACVRTSTTKQIVTELGRDVDPFMRTQANDMVVNMQPSMRSIAIW